MVKSILITMCLANDMISPIKKHQIPPNDLHIGFYETERLLGIDWQNGPLMNFLKSCYKENGKDLNIIHIRDWHNLKDPMQKKELEKYGSHCIENTWGAEFIWENKGILPEKKNSFIINSKKIFTVSENEFSKVLKKIIGNTPKSEVKIGIIGVLTNIKVAQMAIGLQGIYNIENIGICSALTASNNIRKHFQALDDLSNIYGMEIFNSIKLFSQWLKIDTNIDYKLNKFDVPSMKLIGGSNLTKEQEKITGYLFKDCKSIEMKELTGGYSGSKVYLINSIDREGSTQFQSVLKLDKMENIGKERIGFEKIEPILGPHVPKILNSIETDYGAGIRYSFAMMNRKSKVKSFKEFFMSLDGSKKDDLDKVEKSLLTLYEEIFEPLYRNWTLEQKQLWKSNTFKLEYLGFIVTNIKKILGFVPYDEKINLKGIGEFYNPLNFYNEETISSKLKEPISYVRQSLAHGDLNCANIIMDDNFNMWLIDFFHTDYDYHVIQDIVKLENDLKFIHTPIKNAQELKMMAEFEKILVKHEKLSEPLPPLSKDYKKYPNIIRLHLAIKMLRDFAYKISNDAQIRHYRIPQLRYSGHNLCFDESDDLQKKYALISTSMLCEYFNKNDKSKKN